MTNTDPPDELLTPGQAAALIGIDRDTLGAWARRKVLPFQRTRPGGHRRYKRKDVEALIRADDSAPATTGQAAS